MTTQRSHILLDAYQLRRGRHLTEPSTSIQRTTRTAYPELRSHRPGTRQAREAGRCHVPGPALHPFAPLAQPAELYSYPLTVNVETQDDRDALDTLRDVPAGTRYDSDRRTPERLAHAGYFK